MVSSKEEAVRGGVAESTGCGRETASQRCFLIRTCIRARFRKLLTKDYGLRTTKNVLLGEQPVSKAGGVGSNPTVLAWPCDAAGDGDLIVDQARRVRLPYRALLERNNCKLQNADFKLAIRILQFAIVFPSWGRADRHPSDTRGQVGSTPTGWTDDLVEQRNARHPDMVEAGGSNPPEITP